jgi:hypothetical protein
MSKNRHGRLMLLQAGEKKRETTPAYQEAFRSAGTSRGWSQAQRRPLTGHFPSNHYPLASAHLPHHNHVQHSLLHFIRLFFTTQRRFTANENVQPAEASACRFQILLPCRWPTGPGLFSGAYPTIHQEFLPQSLVLSTRLYRALRSLALNARNTS